MFLDKEVFVIYHKGCLVYLFYKKPNIPYIKVMQLFYYAIAQ